MFICVLAPEAEHEALHLDRIMAVQTGDLKQGRKRARKRIPEEIAAKISVVFPPARCYSFLRSMDLGDHPWSGGIERRRMERKR